ncbi:embryonic pepsinogen-like, partial [Paramisgurnus dabryanus]|uniref:embryonic pepsinogen-like n=1 Tax=Paramisgurnus dabryanus TaxID=90735 RepID=UPI003CCF49A6
FECQIIGFEKETLKGIKGSMAVFGKIDSSYYTGSISWIPITSEICRSTGKQSISLTFDLFCVVINSLVLACSGVCQVIVDTSGTSVIVVSSTDINNVTLKHMII